MVEFCIMAAASIASALLVGMFILLDLINKSKFHKDETELFTQEQIEEFKKACCWKDE